MINFFRKIRRRLLTENKFSKYLLYAIGEIALVMVGILLALQVNNWNEERKDRDQEIQLYGDLLESLRADSADVARIHEIHEHGMSAQRFLIGTSLEDLLTYSSIEELGDSIQQTSLVGVSFFPRYGAYRQITNNGYLKLLHAEGIKSKLVELYDRIYLRYQHIDGSIDQKSELHYEPIIRGDLHLLYLSGGISSSEEFDADLFKTHYPAFKRECLSIFTTAVYAQDALENCRKGIHELLILIREKLASSNP